MSGGRVTLLHAAEALGKNRATLGRWVKYAGTEGLWWWRLETGGGRHKEIDLDRCTAWAISQGLLHKDKGARPQVARDLAGDGSEVPSKSVKRSKSRRAMVAKDKVEAKEREEAAAEEPEEEGPRFDAEDFSAVAGFIGSDSKEAQQLLELNDDAIRKLSAHARARKEHHEAEKKELEVRKRRGELVEVADVRQAWLSQVAAVQARFRALPGQLAQKLSGADYDEIYEVLEQELHSVLVGFSKDSLL